MDTPYVFPSWGKAGHIVDPRATFIEISKAAGLTVSPHDLRRTLLDVGNDYCGIDMLKIKLLMQHSIKKDVTAAHYMRVSKLQNLAPAIQAIGDWIEGQGHRASVAAAVLAGENVVSLPKRA